MRTKYEDVALLMDALEQARIEQNHSMEKAARLIGVSYVTFWQWVRKGQEPSYTNGVAIRGYIERQCDGQA